MNIWYDFVVVFTLATILFKLVFSPFSNQTKHNLRFIGVLWWFHFKNYFSCANLITSSFWSMSYQNADLNDG